MKIPAAAILVGLGLASQAWSQDEHEHRHARRFEGAIGDGSLFVSPCGKPYRAGPGEPYPVDAWFREADTNHDGVLERSEFRAEAAAFFDVLDVNHDGVIDGAEVDRYEREIVPEILRRRPSTRASNEAQLILAQYGGGGGGGHSHRHQGGGAQHAAPDAAQSEMVGAAPYDLLAEPEPVTAADLRFDGRITKEEFIAAADRRFDALDVKHTGRIALSDLPQTAVQRRAGEGRGRPERSS